MVVFYFINYRTDYRILAHVDPNTSNQINFEFQNHSVCLSLHRHPLSLKSRLGKTSPVLGEKSFLVEMIATSVIILPGDWVLTVRDIAGWFSLI